MRVIDHPTPNTLVVGSAAGGLYVYTVTGWELSRDEYGSEDVKLTAVDPRMPWRYIEVFDHEPIPVAVSAIPETSVIRRREVHLIDYMIHGIRCRYGFDRESTTFFVQGS